ncbi:C4-dicarboxylate ABC transporter substrate-binding protein [Rhizocola hellebori]|uniref:C4-dicarboxylate ABC transporter substrate-binding protein n=1 Tax=Rhizocola hellebori TaxID=1392758 RepID=A0A8J3QE48_9ACTN|nr:TAXI family TRAP transporter solute-binding subunit [Rhizocola hellebori]GIH07955.1 C4-dicarboxylate ABC transporter substrate-binding protein [Rhizocola hellebori]
MNRSIAVTLVFSLGLALTGCGGRQENEKGDTAAQITCTVEKETRISIATGNTTGVYFALGNAYAEQISAATGGKVKATAAETGASVQNIQQLVAGNYQVAFSLADTAADAVQGKESFDKAQPVQALARIYSNSTQVLARTGSGINTVADMKGKKVSTGSPKSGTEVIANRVLRAAGLDPDKDISAQRLDLTKTVDGMKDGSIDAMFFSGGLPTPGITDLTTTARDKVRFIDIAALTTEMKKINPVYEEGLIPAAVYQTQADVKTIVVPNVLLVKDDIDVNLACVLTKALYNKQPELMKVNGAARGITLDVARKTAPVVLNRGAEKALDALNAAK